MLFRLIRGKGQGVAVQDDAENADNPDHGDLAHFPSLLSSAIVIPFGPGSKVRESDLGKAESMA